MMRYMENSGFQFRIDDLYFGKLYSRLNCILSVFYFSLIEICTSFTFKTDILESRTRSVDTYWSNVNEISSKPNVKYCLCRESHQANQTNVRDVSNALPGCVISNWWFRSYKTIDGQRHLLTNFFTKSNYFTRTRKKKQQHMNKIEQNVLS